MRKLNLWQLLFSKTITLPVLLVLQVFFLFNSCIETTTNKIKDPSLVLRFAMASDGHYGQADTDYETNYNILIENLNADHHDKGLDLVILIGDVFHNDPKFLREVKEKLDELEMPYYVVRGNHDMADDKRWEKIWGYPDNYDFEIGDYAIILASTSDETGEYLCADIEWLWDRLDFYQHKKGVFVFMHISPRKWIGAGIDCPEIRNCLESHSNILGVFQGHDHNEDGLKIWNGVPYYFDGHFGGSWGTGYRGYRVVEIRNNGIIYTYQYNMEVNPVVNENTHHLAFLRMGKLTNPPSEKYDPGTMALTDGVFGSLNYRDGNWIGWEEKDFEWVLDLGMITEIHKIKVDFLTNMAACIFPPKLVEIFVSIDGSEFENVYSNEPGESDELSAISKNEFLVTFKGLPCKFIKIKAVNHGLCPEWHESAGEMAWLFVDEILIN